MMYEIDKPKAVILNSEWLVRVEAQPRSRWAALWYDEILPSIQFGAVAGVIAAVMYVLFAWPRFS